MDASVQIRAVAHALEGHIHVFAPIPKVMLSVKALQVSCQCCIGAHQVLEAQPMRIIRVWDMGAD